MNTGGNTTEIPMDVMLDNRLSFRARGLFVTMLMSNQVVPDQLVAEGGEGIAAIRTAIRELKTLGYVRHWRTNSGKGRGVTWHHSFHPHGE